MSALPVSIQIIAQVSAAERAGMQTGAEFLSSSMKAVRQGITQPMKLAFVDESADPNVLPMGQVFILSMQTELARPAEDMDAVMARWMSRLEALKARPGLLFLCNIFRLADEPVQPGGSSDLVARIRRLNLIAIQLSHATGVNIIDVDRVLAYFGQRVFRCDYRLDNPRAADAVGHAVASAILSSGPDDIIEPVDQEKARQALGDIDSLPRLIRRREEARKRAAQQNG